jgi:hypothetical protein
VPFKVYDTEKSGHNVEQDKNGNLFLDYQWGYQEYKLKEYQIGRHYAYDPDTETDWYDKSSVGYDGELLYSFNFIHNSGAIRFDNLYFRDMWAPYKLWGKNFYGLITTDNNLIDIFRTAEIVDDKDLPDHIKKLSVVKYHQNTGRGETIQRFDRYNLWIDMKRGFMPIKFHKVIDYPPIIIMGNEVEDMVEFLPGIWVPTKGRWLFERVVATIVPNGLSIDEWERMWMAKRKEGLSAQEIFEKAMSELKYTTKMKYQIVVLDTEKLVLNKPIPNDKFVYQFNQGDKIWNALKQRGDVVGVDDSNIVKLSIPPIKRSTDFFWRILFGLSGFCIVVITLFWAVRKSRKM